ncbi:uncharacterized protein LOC113338587 [Papaver somniferum]|uniref:uncharacterized protein LOC113338587 n=1 Tax=Papaver somniferum TaxID=3469 RepID=UPI000E6F48F6|nr:uncharacterized protein LOC113338587 [Papaver somniferum]
MFILHQGYDMLILVLYVDDIMLTGSSSLLMDKLVQALTSEFLMKELGDLNYFLGLRVLVHAGKLLDNPDEYRMIVGSPQYLTLTKPDIFFGVTYMSQFMNVSTDKNLFLVKRI